MRNLFKRMFYAPKYEKLTDDNFIQMIIPSLLGVAICAICLVSLTLAWFTASVETETDTFNTNRFVLSTIEVREGSPFGSELPSDDGWYSLENGKTYTIILRDNGASGQGNGYAVLSVKNPDSSDEKKLYTEPIKYSTAGYNFGFTIKAVSDFSLKIEYGWGNSGEPASISNDGEYSLPSGALSYSMKKRFAIQTPDEPDNSELDSSDTDNQLNPDGTYTVKHGETLEDIAEKFNTTSEMIMVYNEFESDDMIVEGKRIKIPPEGSVLVKTEVTTYGNEPNESKSDNSELPSESIESAVESSSSEETQTTSKTESSIEDNTEIDREMPHS